MTWGETTSWIFLLREIFNFTVFKFWSVSFSILALVSPKNRMIWVTFYGKVMSIQEDRISWPDTARQCIWERGKMSQLQAIPLCVCSKGHASWLWLVVFDPYFFVHVRASVRSRKKKSRDFQGQIRGKNSRFRGNFRGQFRWKTIGKERPISWELPEQISLESDWFCADLRIESFQWN